MNTIVHLFARHIKDFIPEQVEKALAKNLQEKPVLPWEKLHQTLKEVAEKAKLPKDQRTPAPVKIEGKVFSGWAVVRVNPKKGFLARFTKTHGSAAWLEVLDRQAGLQLHWYNEKGPYAPKEIAEKCMTLDVDERCLNDIDRSIDVNSDKEGALSFHIGARYDELKKIIRAKKASWSQEIQYSVDYYVKMRDVLQREPRPEDIVKTSTGEQLEFRRFVDFQGEDLTRRFPIKIIKEAPAAENTERALRSYEKFHGLPAGTATIDQVQNTSAGIEGWSNFQDAENSSSSPGEPTTVVDS